MQIVPVKPTSLAEVAYLSTIRVVATKQDGLCRISSGFVIVDAAELFLVTARHAVESADVVTLYFYPGTDDGPTLSNHIPRDVRDVSSFFVFHPQPDIDVAVGRLHGVVQAMRNDGESIFVRGIWSESFALKWSQGDPTISDPFVRPRPLDEVQIVGYPNNYRDFHTGLPIMRRGLIATPLWLDFGGEPIFLIDTTACHGTSGGPVFFVEEMQKVGKTMHGDSGNLMLLGVFTEALPMKSIGARSGEKLLPPNLGAAVKAHTILETIEHIRSIDFSNRPGVS